MQSFYKFKGKPVLRTAIQMLYGWRKLLLMLLCLCFSAQALAVTLQDVRYNRLPDKTQLVLDLDRPTVFRQFSLAGPPRIVLDLPDAARSGRAGLTLNTGAVSSIRTGFSNETTLRVVIDLLYPAKANIYTMPPENGRGNRIVIDIYDNLAEQALTLESLEEAQPPYVVFAGEALENGRDNGGISIASPPGSMPLPQNPPPVASTGYPNGNLPRTSTAPPPFMQTAPLPQTAPRPQPNIVAVTPPPRPAPHVRPIPAPTTVTVERDISSTGRIEKQNKILTPTAISKRTIVVAIDPGHGGKDTGAVNPNTGLREKDVVLQIAHRLKKQLNSRKGFSAFLTRDGDTYIPLQERPASARRRGADIFVSIHADSAESDQPSGASVFILSTKGANTQLGKYLERTENTVDQRWGVDVSKYDNDVQQALLSIQQEATIEASHALASRTLNELARLGNIHGKRVNSANFVVLRSLAVPSMLVETAFISNPNEARKLASPDYQEQLARGIANGIARYFEEHLPQHMLLGK